MQNLLAGYAITVVALATIDGVSNVVSSVCEYARNSINLATAKKQLEINKLAKLQQQLECENTRVIGFTTQNDAEEDDDEYDD